METVAHVIKHSQRFSTPGRDPILVLSRTKTVLQYSNGSVIVGGVKYRRGQKICVFLQTSPTVSETVQEGS